MNTQEAHWILSSVLHDNHDIYHAVYDPELTASDLLDWLNKEEPEHHDLEYLLGVCLDGDLDTWVCSLCNERKHRFLGPDTPDGVKDEWPPRFEPDFGDFEACRDCVKSALRIGSEVLAE